MKVSELQTIINEAKVTTRKDYDDDRGSIFAFDLSKKLNKQCEIEAKDKADARQKLFDAIIAEPASLRGFEIEEDTL